MSLPWIRLGALSGAATVLLGAFGAHALEARLEPDALETWNTGVHYQGLHALALLLFGIQAERRRTRGLGAGGAGWAFLLGTLLFSGSLYGLALDGPRWLGPVTPLGGLSFLAGWLLLTFQGPIPPEKASVRYED